MTVDDPILLPERHEATKCTKENRMSEPIPPETEHVATEIVDSAFKVHSHLGAGVVESVYERCMKHELTKRGLGVRQQVRLPIVYDGLRLEGALRLDLIVENRVIVELKAVETLLSVHKAQLLSYLKLSGHRLGLLINFCVPLIRDGIKRIAL